MPRPPEGPRYGSARARAEAGDRGFENTSLNIPEGVHEFRPKPGVYQLEIIPFTVGAGNPFCDEGQLYYERTYFTHRAIGPNQDTYVCPAKTSNQPCPICEEMRRLERDPRADPKLVKEMRPKQRQLFQVLDRKAPDQGVQIWDVSYHLFGKLLNERINNSPPEEGWENFFYLGLDGMTLRVTFTEQKNEGYTYTEVTAIDFIKRVKPLPADIVDEGHCLDDVLKIVPYDQLKKIFLQVDSGDEQPAPAPTRRPAAAPARRAAAPVQEELPPEEEELPEEEEAPPPPPVRRPTQAPAPRKAAAAPPPEEENWDDPAPVAAKPAARKAAPAPVAEEESFGEDEPPVAPARSSKPAAKRPVVAAEDDWDAAPPARPAARPAAAKPAAPARRAAPIAPEEEQY